MCDSAPLMYLKFFADVPLFSAEAMSTLGVPSLPVLLVCNLFCFVSYSVQNQSIQLLVNEGHSRPAH